MHILSLIQPKNFMNKFLAFLLFIICLTGCQSKVSLHEKLISKWKIDKVMESSNDVTSQHNPKNNRWISLRDDGSFESDGDPYGHNTGKWVFTEKDSTLFIDSDTEGDDSTWKIRFDGEKLIMTGVGTPRQQSFQLEFSRIEQ